MRIMVVTFIMVAMVIMVTQCYQSRIWDLAWHLAGYKGELWDFWAKLDLFGVLFRLRQSPKFVTSSNALINCQKQKTALWINLVSLLPSLIVPFVFWNSHLGVSTAETKRWISQLFRMIHSVFAQSCSSAGVSHFCCLHWHKGDPPRRPTQGRGSPRFDKCLAPSTTSDATSVEKATPMMCLAMRRNSRKWPVCSRRETE